MALLCKDSIHTKKSVSFSLILSSCANFILFIRVNGQTCVKVLVFYEKNENMSALFVLNIYCNFTIYSIQGLFLQFEQFENLWSKNNNKVLKFIDNNRYEYSGLLSIFLVRKIYSLFTLR